MVYSVSEVTEILCSEMGDEGFRVKEGALLELSVPMKPGTWLLPQEALLGDRGHPLCSGSFWSHG